MYSLIAFIVLAYVFFINKKKEFNELYEMDLVLFYAIIGNILLFVVEFALNAFKYFTIT